MSEQPCQVPLIEQLRSVPLNAHHLVELPNNAGYRNIPYGPWCNAAADEIYSYRQQAEINARTVREQAEYITKLRGLLIEADSCISHVDGYRDQPYMDRLCERIDEALDK